MFEPKTHRLSPLDWLMPRSYVSHIICFASSSAPVPQILRNGLVGTLKDVPYLASEIVDQSRPKGSVTLSEPCAGVDDLFYMRDLSATVNYNDLRAQDFAPSTFNGLDVFGALGCSASRPRVFQAMLTLMSGGFVLSVSVHHSTTDITGFGALLKIWASHCSSHSSRPISFSDNWLDRGALFPIRHEVADAAPIDLPALLHREAEDDVQKREPVENFDQLETLIFKYSSNTLRTLKDEVIQRLDTDEIPWVSTSDILYGLLWSAVIYAENQDQIDTASVNLARRSILRRKQVRHLRIPVNVRGRLSPSLPQNYLGAAFGVCLATVEKADLIDIGAKSGEESIAALARVAMAVRKAISSVDDKAIKEAVAYLAAQDDLTGLKLGPQAAHVTIVSWADENVYELDWGKDLGHCEAVRIPELRKKRHPIILPRLTNGDLEFLVCFNKSTMDLFRDGLIRNLQ
ncbi:hypothetical protein NM208_g916 [Fusarium decemcellulare]|uniref:Uncharacterized protein n=1 Tax=Fusarium decemcellulare TaxID=57161 RepID=A0ACC1SY60_9HYPO|nr:hypothetical protein NM208_g916 [Fusarium decemcellulare]